MILELFHHSYISNFRGASTDLNRQEICIYSRILSPFHHFISACKMSWKRSVKFNHSKPKSYQWIKKMWYILYIYIYNSILWNIYYIIYVIYGIYNRILFSLQKEGILAFCNNMDELKGYHTKWNKPDTERNKPFTYM